jgi:hypothetical protein
MTLGNLSRTACARKSELVCESETQMVSKATQISCGLFVLLLAVPYLSAATIVLNFADVNPGNANVLYLSQPYVNQGFILSSAGPTPGFNTYGTGTTGFFSGAPGLSPLTGGVVDLRAADGSTFVLSSLDLARNFAFDPAPIVTFTGNLAGGGTVTQTVTVTTAIGTPAFQNFDFTGFNNLVSVNWNQASTPAAGLHQFTGVTIETGTTTAVPEPSSMLLFGTGAVVAFALLRKTTYISND